MLTRAKRNVTRMELATRGRLRSETQCKPSTVQRELALPDHVDCCRVDDTRGAGAWRSGAAAERNARQGGSEDVRRAWSASESNASRAGGRLNFRSESLATRCLTPQHTRKLIAIQRQATRAIGCRHRATAAATVEQLGAAVGPTGISSPRLQNQRTRRRHPDAPHRSSNQTRCRRCSSCRLSSSEVSYRLQQCDERCCPARSAHDMHTSNAPSQIPLPLPRRRQRPVPLRHVRRLRPERMTRHLRRRRRPLTGSDRRINETTHRIGPRRQRGCRWRLSDQTRVRRTSSHAGLPLPSIFGES